MSNLITLITSRPYCARIGAGPLSTRPAPRPAFVAATGVSAHA